jgi:hypothetical protein
MLHRNMTPCTHQASTSCVPAPPDHVVGEPRPARSQVFRSKVYRAKETHDWIVEPPRDRISAEDIKVFTGPRAQQLALTYAYEEYGNARFFPY